MMCFEQGRDVNPGMFSKCHSVGHSKSRSRESSEEAAAEFKVGGAGGKGRGVVRGWQI